MALPAGRNLATDWWTNQQTKSNIEQIRVGQEVERERLDFQKERFDEILSLYKTAFGEVGGDGGFNVPSEFAENVALFQPGGQFGAGSRAISERATQEAIAAGQVGMARTGMSSGTNVAGLQARAFSDQAIRDAMTEQQRTQLLGGALTQAGTAELSAQELRARRETALLASLSSFGRV
jgi:hypothetical protein